MKRKSALPYLLAVLGIVVLGAAVVLYVLPKFTEQPQQMQTVETQPAFTMPVPVPTEPPETQPEEIPEYEWTIEDTAKIYLMKFPELFGNVNPDNSASQTERDVFIRDFSTGVRISKSIAGKVYDIFKNKLLFNSIKFVGKYDMGDLIWEVKADAFSVLVTADSAEIYQIFIPHFCTFYRDGKVENTKFTMGNLE